MKKKYGPGEPIRSLAALDIALKDKIPVYVTNWKKATSAGFVVNMAYGQVKKMIENNGISFAKKI